MKEKERLLPECFLTWTSILESSGDRRNSSNEEVNNKNK